MKEQLYDELKEWGCDIDGAMERFMDDRELYESCLETVLEDASFAQLKVELEAGNVEKAFDAAHTLKGVCGNMGLTPMFDTDVQIVEPLRAGNIDGLMGFYDELMAEKDKLADIMRRNA